MVNLMSEGEFDRGGPYGAGAGGVASGFGQLGQALANAPYMAARAGYMGAESERARAQTEELRQKMGVAAGRQDRIKEAMSILANPGALHDPAVGARLSAIALADPEIAAHFPGLLSGVVAVGALGKAYQQAEADRLAAGTGTAAFGNTATGYGMGLAQGNRNIVTTGEQQRLTDDNAAVQAIPPNAPVGTQPQSMSRGEAKAKGWTVLPDAAVTTNVGPTTVLPRGGGPPETTSGGEAQRTRAQPVLPSDTVKGVTGADTFFPRGPAPPTAPPAAAVPPVPPVPAAPAAAAPPAPAQSGENTATPPSSDTAQADDTSPAAVLATADDQQGSPLAAIMSGIQRADATPAASVPGAVLAAGPAAGETPPPAPAAPAPSASAPPPAPGQPPSPVGQQFQDDAMARAQRVGNLWRALEGNPPVVPPVSKMTPKEELEFGQLIDLNATERYPQDPTSWHPGAPSQYGPATFAAISDRAHQLYTTLGSPTRENPGASIQQAVKEFEASGRLPPPGFRPTAWPLAQTLGYGQNIVDLKPGQQAPAAPAQPPAAAPAAAPAAPPAAAANQNQPAPTTATNPKTGQKYVLMNGQWVEVGANQSAPAQASGQ